MTIPAFEGVVEHGRIRLCDNVTLPENATVYVLIPSVESVPKARIHSPRLAHPDQAADFAKQIVGVCADADL
jgi:hypothetical protein